MRVEILSYADGPEGRLFVRARVTREEFADDGLTPRPVVRVMSINLGPWPSSEHTDEVVVSAAQQYWPRATVTLALETP